jgi:sialate O-acetylesterase
MSVAVLVFALAATSRAEEALPFLHPLFTDNAVLQRDAECPVWGWTTPGAKVTVSMAGRHAVATACATGEWMAMLGPLGAGGPHTLSVRGRKSVTVRNVMIGDVWVCSGQSNMQWPLRASNNAAEEIAAANFPNIRLFSVPRRIAHEPRKTCEASWQVCSPESVGGFTAVGYFFGRHLNRELGVPIGLIHTSWGGTIAEAWTSAEALKTMPDFKQPVEKFLESVAKVTNNSYDYDAEMKKWWAKNDLGSKAGAEWFRAGFDDSSWKKMRLPTGWEKTELGAFDGIVWFRKSFDLPADWAGKDLKLGLGPIDDADVTWFNGTQVGSMTRWNQPRNYTVPGKLVKAGRNVVTVRCLDTGGGGGIFGKPEQMKLEREGAATISLAGDWRYKAAGSLAKLSPTPRRPRRSPNTTTVLYNGMIAPLLPMAIKGAIWYQGESNASRPYQYRRLLPTMIHDWRNAFSCGYFGFYIVQLANFKARTTEPVQSGWAELREAQFITSETMANVGQAVIIDIGAARNIHPKNKQDVGKRLALSALGITYGKNITYSGPIYSKMSREGAHVRLWFAQAGRGLVAKGGELKGFAIAGADKRFFHALAVIDGRTVVVSAPEVTAPVAVRYGWANNPVCKLYNEEGLPATPFRTDIEDKFAP